MESGSERKVEMERIEERGYCFFGKEELFDFIPRILYKIKGNRPLDEYVSLWRLTNHQRVKKYTIIGVEWKDAWPRN